MLQGQQDIHRAAHCVEAKPASSSQGKRSVDTLHCTPYLSRFLLPPPWGVLYVYAYA